MPRKEDASAADAVKRVVLGNGQGPDVSQLLAEKAKSIFYARITEMSFDMALGAIYEQAITDYIESTPKRKRKANKKPAVAQTSSGMLSDS